MTQVARAKKDWPLNGLCSTGGELLFFKLCAHNLNEHVTSSIVIFVLDPLLGSSPTFLVALVVMCVACLAGTALMIFKKSRDKPAGYTLLVSEDQK